MRKCDVRKKKTFRITSTSLYYLKYLIGRFKNFVRNFFNVRIRGAMRVMNKKIEIGRQFARIRIIF